MSCFFARAPAGVLMRRPGYAADMATPVEDYTTSYTHAHDGEQD
ncbi:hypothetical protein [Streptomyces mirabilis]